MSDKWYQQGDVIIEPVQGIPDGSKRISAGPRGFVLAEGEVTGHAHVIEREAEELAGLMMYRGEDGYYYIRIERPVTVRHEEHRAIEIPEGFYRVRRVREYDHFAEEARPVVD